MRVYSPISCREETRNHGSGSCAGSREEGVQMPMCHSIIRQGVQVSRCPFSRGPCGLQGSGSGVQTHVRIHQLSSRKMEGKPYSGQEPGQCPAPEECGLYGYYEPPIAPLSGTSPRGPPKCPHQVPQPRLLIQWGHWLPAPSAKQLSGLPGCSPQCLPAPLYPQAQGKSLLHRRRNCLPVPRWAATQTLLPIHHPPLTAWGLSLPPCA